MSDETKVTPGADLIARALCLVVAAALALTSLVLLNRNAELGFWILAAASAACVVLGLFGPRRIRTAIISTLPGF